jgi:hypothetical protein
MHWSNVDTVYPEFELMIKAKSFYVVEIISQLNHIVLLSRYLTGDILMKSVTKI